MVLVGSKRPEARPASANFLASHGGFAMHASGGLWDIYVAITETPVAVVVARALWGIHEIFVYKRSKSTNLHTPDVCCPRAWRRTFRRS